MSKKKSSKKEEGKYKKVKEAVKKEKQKEIKNVKAVLATRKLLEEDYKKDTFFAEFETSSGKFVKVEVTKPSTGDSKKIVELSIAAQSVENSDDPDDLLKTQEIQQNLADMAGKLSIDKDLDSEFWYNCVSSQTLVNFVVGIVISSQGASDEELRNFRK